MKPLNRIGSVFKRGEAIFWARRRKLILPIVEHLYSYETPAVGAAPAVGSIVHASNVINKLAVSHTDLDGNSIAATIGQITTGDTVAIGGTHYTVIAPTVADTGFSYITISPSTQKQPGIYPVKAWR